MDSILSLFCRASGAFELISELVWKMQYGGGFPSVLQVSHDLRTTRLPSILNFMVLSQVRIVQKSLGPLPNLSARSR